MKRVFGRGWRLDNPKNRRFSIFNFQFVILPSEIPNSQARLILASSDFDYAQDDTDGFLPNKQSTHQTKNKKFPTLESS